MTTGSSASRSNRRASHHRVNRPTAWAYASRVFLLRMFAVKNSTNRREARSPASVIRRGSRSKPDELIMGGDEIGAGSAGFMRFRDYPLPASGSDSVRGEFARYQPRTSSRESSH